MIILMVMVDVKLIMPTVLILLFTLFIMVTVIPYAFSSVIKQLRAVQALEELEAAGSDISKISRERLQPGLVMTKYFQKLQPGPTLL